MKSFRCVDLLICCLCLIVTLFGFSKAEFEQTKNRRGVSGASGLYASFPRVGRSDPNLQSTSNNQHDADSAAALAYIESLYPAAAMSAADDYEDYAKSEIKRANLIPFPRVGRSDGDFRKLARFVALQQNSEKRLGPTSAIWFGPRLGKRSVDKVSENLNNKGQKEIY